MKSMDADALRVQKLGIDDAGNTFWYFYGTRLYKEEPIEEKKTWDEEWKEQKRKSMAKKRGRGRPPKKKNAENEVDEETPKEDDRYMNVSEKSRWSVACDTLEEWVNFAEKYKNCKSKNEKSLFEIISENFLPTLSKIYEEKERKLQEKVKELLPAREKIVTRRETRRLRGDTGGDINYALLNGFDSDEEEYRRHSDYSMFREVKSRAERLEERNKRASEIGSTQDYKKMKYNDESKRSSESSENSSESGDLDVTSQMIKLLSNVRLHKDAWPFIYPVDEKEAPGYYEIIKDPVDLSTIGKRLHNGDYETVGDLDADFSKMVSNCELYNGENHAFSKMAQTLRVFFRKEIADLLERVEEAAESSNGNSDESNDSQYNSSSNSNSSSPPHDSPVAESREYKKVKDKKKKKKHSRNMEALEVLAQASDISVQKSNSNDMLNISNTYGEQKICNDFPNLKIVPIHSHPQSYIEKYSSNSSKESNSEGDINEKADNDGQYLSSSPTDSAISSASEAHYMNNLTHLTNFIEKDSDKNLNILSNNDLTSVLQENDSDYSSSSAASFTKSVASSGNLHSVDNIFDGCSENFISQFMKPPTYNACYQVVPQSKFLYEESLPKSDLNSNRKRDRSPSFAGHMVPETNPQESTNLQSNPGSPSDNITTIDASVLGISLNPWKKKPRNLENSGSGFLRPENASSDVMQNEMQLENNNSYKPNQTSPPNEINQHSPPSSEQAINLPITSYQPLNFDYMNPNKSFQTTFNQNNPTYCNSPLQMLSSYVKTVQQQDKIQMHSPVNNSSNLFNSEQTVCLPMPPYQPLGINNSSNIVPFTLSQTHLVNSSNYSSSFSKTDKQVKVQKQSLSDKTQESSNPTFSEQTIPSYQPFNLNSMYSNSTVPTTCIPTLPPNINANFPLHIPASYPKTVEQQALKPTNSFYGLSKTHNQFMPNSEMNKGSAVTYHVFSHNKSNLNSVPEHMHYMNNTSGVPIQMASSLENRANQDNITNSPSSPQKASPLDTRPAPCYANPSPPQKIPAVVEDTRPAPCYANPSTPQKTSVIQDTRPVACYTNPSPPQKVSSVQDTRPTPCYASPSPPQKVSHVLQDTRPAPCYVPSTNKPCYAASSSSPTTNKTLAPVTFSNIISVNTVPVTSSSFIPANSSPQGSVPVTSSNFISVNSSSQTSVPVTSSNFISVNSSPQRTVPVTNSSFVSVNSSPQGIVKNKPVIIRTKAANVINRSPIVENVAVTSLNTAPNNSSNISMQQTNVNQPFPTQTVVFARRPVNQAGLSAASMQSNFCLPNGMPVMQQVVLPPGTQLPNTGQQYIIASPQNTYRIFNKDQTVSLQNNVGQLNQGFVKVVPQLITPTMQISKEGMQNFQLQTLSPNNTQAYTQVAQNPQFVSVPYVVNQNSMTNSTSQPTLNYQSFQIPTRPMHIGGQGNG